MTHLYSIYMTYNTLIIIATLCGEVAGKVEKSIILVKSGYALMVATTDIY